jgi:dihydrodipicolinate synthase/N-acetylneuraminate lyase
MLLPHTVDGDVDWGSFENLLTRTAEAGLVPAVNMDTGFAQLIDEPTRHRVLDVAAEIVGAGFLAGALVADHEGDAFDDAGYERAMSAIAERGGVPVVFPSHGLNALDPAGWVAAHERMATSCDRFVAFELGAMFVPYGRIFPLEAYRGLLDIPNCVGAKHSSLSRRAEWDRLALRDEHRPDFAVLTGNDLAIDMVCYGSDYLLGLATFAPDLFARRDAAWAARSDDFYELNDRLQYLGAFAFRDPVPAYRHDAAMFLRLRGWISSDEVPGGSPRRPDADRDVLRELAHRLEVLA